MVKIALFAEGHTDQLVLRNVLLGGSQFDEEPEVHFVQPLAPGRGANGSYAPGGWTVLFDALRRGEHRKALQYNDLLVIHVDTDVCDEVGFGVTKVADPENCSRALRARSLRWVQLQPTCGRLAGASLFPRRNKLAQLRSGRQRFWQVRRKTIGSLAWDQGWVI